MRDEWSGTRSERDTSPQVWTGGGRTAPTVPNILCVIDPLESIETYAPLRRKMHKIKHIDVESSPVYYNL